MSQNNRIYCASDHGGVELKDAVIRHLDARGYDVHDLGAHGTESVDYPDFGALLANRLKDAVGAVGVAICGSGIGISIARTGIAGYGRHWCMMKQQPDWRASIMMPILLHWASARWALPPRWIA